MSSAKSWHRRHEPPRPSHDRAVDEAGRAALDDPLLAKLAQLARFGLAAEAAPILVPADPEEG